MISIDYLTNIIFVPKTYTQFVSTDPQTGAEVRQMDLTIFAQDVADLQAIEGGVWAVTAYEYTAPVSVGGVQLAPVVVVLNPYLVEFEDGQYAVNLVGANTNLQDVAIVNQVSIRPNNSAGLTFSDEVQILAFQDASVWVDTIDGQAGTQYPRGTVGNRVNNAADAMTIANRIGFHRFRLEGTESLTGNPIVERYEVIGNTPTSAVIIGTNLGVEGAAFERVAMVGSISGRGSFQDCSLGKTLNLAGFQGIADNCGIAGNITMDAAATEPTVFKDCISALAGLSKPILDCNGTASPISFRRYAGGLEVRNFNNAAGTMSLDIMGAEVTIQSTTCTNGEMVIRGVGRAIDENGTLIAQGQSTINGNLVVKNFSITADQITGISGSGNSPWTEAEKDQLIADMDTTKRQSIKTANQTQRYFPG